MTKLTRRRFLTISAASAALAATSTTLPASSVFAEPVTWRGYAFGAEVSVTLHDESHRADAALAAVRAELVALEKLFSIYDPTSTLSLLNETGSLRNVPSNFRELLEYIDLIHRTTEGLFDPTIQTLFRQRLADVKGVNEAATSSSEHLIGWDKVRRNGHTLLLPIEGMALTFNGIAQGYATDRIADILRGHGFEKTLVNIGEYAAGNRDFRIGIAEADGSLFDVATLKNQAIATSSPAGYRFADGSSHLLHPSGLSKPMVWSTVSVIAERAVYADGFSTALALSQDTRLAEKLTSSGFIQRAILRSQAGEVFKL